MVALVLAVAGSPLLPASGLIAPPSASAWNGASTAAYADTHWNDCKSDQSQPAATPNYSLPWPYGLPGYTSDGYLCFGSPLPGFQNCTAFASEALHAGGYSYVYLSLNDQWYWNLNNESARWIRNPYFSYSFSTAKYLYKFLTVYDHDNHDGTGAGGGWLKRVDIGPGLTLRNNVLVKGDLLFFSLYNGNDPTQIDHTRVETGWYTSAPPRDGQFYQPWNAFVYMGDYANNQSPGRYHDFWNGVYWSSQPGSGVNPQNVVIWEVSIDTRNI